MGYNTTYKFKIDLLVGHLTQALDQTIQDALIEDLANGNDEVEYVLDNNDSKWYQHEEDMKAFSLKHPSFLFTLSGEGEEAGDIWKKYFHAGKMQVAKAEIRCADFDPTQLA